MENSLRLQRSVDKTLQSGYYEIQESDQIEILNYYTVSQIAEFMDITLDPHMNVYVNNKLADKETPVYENFSVMWTAEEMDAPEESVVDTVQEKQEEAIGEPESREENEKEAVLLHLIVNKQPVILKGKAEYVFVDVFEEIDFDLSKPKGKGIVTTLNGRTAQYMEPLHEGDVIEIYWN